MQESALAAVFKLWTFADKTLVKNFRKTLYQADYLNYIWAGAV